MASDPILIFGSNGQVGHELTPAMASLGRVVALDRQGADFSAPESLTASVLEHRPRVIVNAVAYTAVDRAETEEEAARTINADAVHVLAEAADLIGALVIHFSTDYVFDGAKRAPYTEVDATNPNSAYGRTKLEGERAAARAGRHIILRTSWVFGSHGSNFLKTILRIGGERENLRVVADQIGAPTPAALIAVTTATIVNLLCDAPVGDARFGLYHLAAGGETSWHGYARYAIGSAAAGGWPLKARPDSVSAIGSADYPAAARRPANSRLDTSKLRRTFAVDLPDWHVGVDRVLAELLEQRNRTNNSL